MSIFCSKKLPPPTRLCLRLKQTRECLGFSLDSLAAKTRVPKKYLMALDNGDFSALPKSSGYRLAYLRSYAKALNLPPGEIIKQFKREDGLGDIEITHPYRHIKFIPFNSLSFLTRYLIIILSVAIFTVYLIWQVHGVSQPPKLIIYSPAEGSFTTELNILVQGETEKESHLTINGQEVMPDDNGRFESSVDLTTGVNTITIAAVKKHGKTTTETRHVVVKGK